MTRSLRANKSERQSPNFVVILTDDQSWVGSSVLMDPNDTRTRSDYYQTPHIERLAKMGMRFTRGYSPAATDHSENAQTGKSGVYDGPFRKVGFPVRQRDAGRNGL